MLNGLDTDQDRRSVGPDRGSKYFERGSVDDEKSPVTVLSARGDSGVMFCFQSYKGLRIDRSLAY